jgi:hypothetical protein
MTPIRFSPSSLKEGRWYEYLIRFRGHGTSYRYHRHHVGDIGGVFADVDILRQHNLEQLTRGGFWLGEKRGLR